MKLSRFLILTIFIFFKCAILQAQVNDTVVVNGDYNLNKGYYITKIYSNQSKKKHLGDVLYFKGAPISDTLSAISEYFICGKPFLKVTDKRKRYFYDIQTKKPILDFYYSSDEYSYYLYSDEHEILTHEKKKYFVNICDSLIVEIENVYDVQGVDESSVFVNSKTGTTLYDFKNKQQTFYPNAAYYADLKCFCFQDSACYFYDNENVEFKTKLNFTKMVSNPYSRYWIVKKGRYFGLLDHYSYMFKESFFERMNGGAEVPRFKELVDFKYDTIYRIDNPILATKKDGKFGMIYGDKEILPPMYDTVYVSGLLTIYTEKVNGEKKLGLVYDKEILTEPVFSELIYFQEKYFLIKKREKGETEVYVYDPLKVSDIQLFKESLNRIKENNFKYNGLVKIYKMNHFINLYYHNMKWLGSEYHNVGFYFMNADTRLFYFSNYPSKNTVIIKKKGYTLKGVKQNYDIQGNAIYYKDELLGDLPEFSFEFSKGNKVYTQKCYYSLMEGFITKMPNTKK